MPNRCSSVLFVVVLLSAAACGGAASRSAPTRTVPPRLTPIASSVRDVPGCNLLMAYEGGAVFLNFVTPQIDCSAIQKDLSTAGPPFTSVLTPVSRIDLASPTPLCLKSDFRLAEVLIAKVLIVLVNRGQTDRAAVAFCTAWIGPPASAQAA